MKFWHDNKAFHENPRAFFKSKRYRSSGIFIIFAFVFVGTSLLIGFDFLRIFTDIGNAVGRFLKLYFPINFEELDKMLEAIWVTLLLSVTAGTIGTILAYIAALGMSKRTGKNRIIKLVLRFLATFIRNVPASIWAIILLMAFWFGEFLALLVMTLATFGFNARVFADMLDETNHNSIEALEATGSTYWQMIFQGVFPETLPVAISWSLYAIETNIRSSTIIGMLAGGGIGYLIGYYKHFRRFDELMAAVIFIVAAIIIFDQLSIQIRKRIL